MGEYLSEVQAACEMFIVMPEITQAGVGRFFVRFPTLGDIDLDIDIYRIRNNWVVYTDNSHRRMGANLETELRTSVLDYQLNMEYALYAGADVSQVQLLKMGDFWATKDLEQQVETACEEIFTYPVRVYRAGPETFNLYLYLPGKEDLVLKVDHLRGAWVAYVRNRYSNSPDVKQAIRQAFIDHRREVRALNPEKPNALQGYLCEDYSDAQPA